MRRDWGCGPVVKLPVRSWGYGLEVAGLPGLSEVLGSIASTTHTQKEMRAKHNPELKGPQAASSQLDPLLGFQAQNSYQQDSLVGPEG